MLLNGPLKEEKTALWGTTRRFKRSSTRYKKTKLQNGNRMTQKKLYQPCRKTNLLYRGKRGEGPIRGNYRRLELQERGVVKL